MLEVRAIGVNFPDLLFTQGRYQHRPELPVVPGCGIAGVVRDAPPGSGWSPGDRVAAFVWQGGFAELARAPLNTVARVPDGADFTTAAAMVVNYHTVHFGLHRRARLRQGETLLVLGAAGGIGTAALQVGRGLGARVIGGVRTQEQAATATSAGVDDIVMLTDGFSEQLRAMTGGRGVDVVLDPLGDWLFDEAVRALAPEGRILVVGFAAGGIPTLKVNRLLLRNASAVGVAFGAFLDVDPGLMAAQTAALHDLSARGLLHPQIGFRCGFDDLADALLRLQNGQIAGKGVVEVPGGA